MPSKREAFDAGFAAAVEGANQVNSHFTYFLTPELKKSWERGNAAGLLELAGRNHTQTMQRGTL